MRHLTICLLLACAAAPAAAQDTATDHPEPPPVITVEVPEDFDPEDYQDQKAQEPDEAGEEGAKADEEEKFDLSKMMEVFDKIFPAQPDPAPERLVLAQVTAAGVLPNGTYAAIFEEMMSGMVDRVLSLTPADFGAAEGKDGEAVPSTSLREAIAKGDPHFEERMRITRRVIGEELVKVSALIEPKLRQGLARSIARRFDEAQLRDINAFLATDSGRAFGSQTMRMWVDPDVMRSMFKSFPEILMAMPGAIKRLEAATAHLPKPKKPEKEESEEEEAEADAVEAETEEASAE